MRPVSIASFAQSPNVRRDDEHNEVEMLMPVVAEVFGNIGITKDDVDFICSGSTDYLIGGPFSFVMALDAVGVWPPRSESHVEMDGAWALYEAWTLLQEGAIDAALVYAFGRSSLGDLQEILSLQLDPYYLAPLWPDIVSLSALQAQALIDSGKATEAEFAAIAARSRKAALDNPKAQVANDIPAETLLRGRVRGGAAAAPRPAAHHRRGGGHRPGRRGQGPGLGRTSRCGSPASTTGWRPTPWGPATSPRRRRPARPPRWPGWPTVQVDVAELHAPFAHQEVIVRDALGLDGSVTINPSGGPLAANPLMSAGLIRIGEAAERIRSGGARRAVAHATSGPCLQQNLVCVLEGE